MTRARSWLAGHHYLLSHERRLRRVVAGARRHRNTARGRTIEQLAAISGALTLIANVIMAWNTHKMQAIAGHSAYPDELIARFAPTMHQHINMRGILTFNLGPHRPRLLRPLPARPTYVRSA